ncbi:MAG: hypothetical protein FWD99_00285 [Oscillospiraceae bacterium]|nr:hypothetical protein [Oscillospiraceae bacterium]
MTTINKIFRSITLGLQIIAIAAYFLPPLFMGGHFGIGWLALGVLHTAIFCAIFFRNARRRTALSAILMVVLILWCLFLLIIGGLLTLIGAEGLGLQVFGTMFVYIGASFFAAIFALGFPRRFSEGAQEVQGDGEEAQERETVYASQ